MEKVELWPTINHVPPNFRALDGANLNLDQCNEICKVLALKHSRARKRTGLDPVTGAVVEENLLDPDYAKARIEFRQGNEIRMIGNHRVWVLKGGN